MSHKETAIDLISKAHHCYSSNAPMSLLVDALRLIDRLESRIAELEARPIATGCRCRCGGGDWGLP